MWSHHSTCRWTRSTCPSNWEHSSQTEMQLTHIGIRQMSRIQQPCDQGTPPCALDMLTCACLLDFMYKVYFFRGDIEIKDFIFTLYWCWGLWLSFVAINHRLLALSHENSFSMRFYCRFSFFFSFFLNQLIFEYLSSVLLFTVTFFTNHFFIRDHCQLIIYYCSIAPWSVH